VAIIVDYGDMAFLNEVKDDLELSFPLLFGSKRAIKRILREYTNIKQIPTLINVDRVG
jgi:hypothetical protein